MANLPLWRALIVFATNVEYFIKKIKKLVIFKVITPFLYLP